MEARVVGGARVRRGEGVEDKGLTERFDGSDRFRTGSGQIQIC